MTKLAPSCFMEPEPRDDEFHSLGKGIIVYYNYDNSLLKLQE